MLEAQSNRSEFLRTVLHLFADFLKREAAKGEGVLWYTPSDSDGRIRFIPVRNPFVASGGVSSPETTTDTSFCRDEIGADAERGEEERETERVESDEMLMSLRRLIF
ncbi:hypothetical protein [Thermosulfurimonas sp. F29]|uniref:hypothetical protein n=1 Tax=Thermosulfurimonas sp. F29 TaxID=2867247 RepID=UPI001C83EEC8|nr:hypothetical protein [Thermosulfurimonas sp. F29]MBX6424234.1 hypothetical protein [Thermosulfurimonas sp. F29]